MLEHQYGQGVSTYRAIVSFPAVPMATNRYPPVANTWKHQGRRRLLNRFCCGPNDANELRWAPDGLSGRHALAWLTRRPPATSRNQAYRKNRPDHGTRFDTGNNAGMKNSHMRSSRQSRWQVAENTEGGGGAPQGTPTPYRTTPFSALHHSVASLPISQP